ncbi:MAG TPA: HlyD family secretion protein, partial [Bacillota bacterium]
AIPRSEVEDLEKNLFDLKLSLAHLRQEKKEEIEDLRTELMLKSAPSETAPLETPKPASSYSSIQMQRAKIALLEEKLSILKKQLNQSFIRNDQVICNFANGVVAEINYAEGDLFFIEKKAMTIINLDSLVIEANIGEDFIKDVKIGADVLISPVADYSRTYRGKITRLSELAVVENGETVIPVEISFEQHDNFLLPNFNVDVKIYTD